MDTAFGRSKHHMHPIYRVKRFIRQRWLLIVAIVSIVAALCFAGEAASRSFWPTTDATITKVTSKYFPRPYKYNTNAVSRVVYYTYTVQFHNQGFTATKPSSYFDLPLAINPDGSNNVVGKKIKLWVNFDDPRRTTTDPANDFGHGLMLVLLTTVLCCGICVIELGQTHK